MIYTPIISATHSVEHSPPCIHNPPHMLSTLVNECEVDEKTAESSTTTIKRSYWSGSTVRTHVLSAKFGIVVVEMACYLLLVSEETGSSIQCECQKSISLVLSLCSRDMLPFLQIFGKMCCSLMVW